MIRGRGWGQDITVKNINDLSCASQARPFLSIHTLLVLCLAWSTQQYRTFCRYCLLVYNSQDSSQRQLISAICILYGRSFEPGKLQRKQSPRKAKVKEGLGDGVIRTVTAAIGCCWQSRPHGIWLPQHICPVLLLCQAVLSQTSQESKISPYIKKVPLLRGTELFLPCLVGL